MSYRIVRMYFRDEHPTEVVCEGLTKEEATDYLRDDNTSSRTATDPKAVERTAKCGPWFEGFTEE